jgi:glycosyltransferase involved in cell wall biosynthesis
VIGPDESLVSVIVPAWNAEKTLAQTLESAASQTHRHLEILIVDDGSTDATAAIAERFCAVDERARLIRKSNGGQSSARNRGIEEARGAWIAPLDADDLWHPEKIERQLRTFAETSSQVGFVYCWYRLIDERDQVCAPAWSPVFEGRVLNEHLKCNFGTGSSLLIRRSALGDLRYSSEFKAHFDIGCEDWLLQLQIAARHPIACTRAFLLGYRQRPGSTSADAARMTRAHIRMYEIILKELASCNRQVARRELARWRTFRAFGKSASRRLSDRSADMAKALTLAPLFTARIILSQCKQRVRALRSRSADDRAEPGRAFQEFLPEDNDMPSGDGKK